MKKALFLLALAVAARADLLLGTISWPMQGISDSAPPEVNYFGLIINGQGWDVMGLPTSDKALQDVEASLTNGIDDNVLTFGTISYTAGSSLHTKESAIPAFVPKFGPDFVGYQVTGLTPRASDINAEQRPTGDWNFTATANWDIFGVRSQSVPEGSSALLLALCAGVAFTAKCLRRGPERRQPSNRS